MSISYSEYVKFINWSCCTADCWVAVRDCFIGWEYRTAERNTWWAAGTLHVCQLKRVSCLYKSTYLIVVQYIWIRSML